MKNQHYYDLDINCRINWKANLRFSGLMTNNFFTDLGFLREVSLEGYNKLLIKSY